MKRIIYDVPRWNIYLHRRARGLPLVDKTDTKERRIADEIFDLLFMGDLNKKRLGKKHRDASADDVTWARAVHDRAKSLSGTNGGQHGAGANAAGVDFKQLMHDCKGHAEKSAQATKQVLDAMSQPDPYADQSDDIASGSARDAADGLDQVEMDGAGKGNQGTGEWKGEYEANERALSLAEKLKNDERLKKIALLAGKFKRIVVTKQKTVVRRGADEVSDIMQGDDLMRLLPSEMIRFASKKHRLSVIRDLMERKCLQYQMTSKELLGRGPLVLCVDKSPSMEGDKDTWACAVALALMDMAHRQRRAFILLGFNDTVPQRVVVKPGEPLPEKELFFPCSGGTNITNVLDLALRATETRKVMNRADIIIVTDGESDTKEAKWIRQRALKNDVTIIGIGIQTPARALKPWCSQVHCVENMNNIDDEVATTIFGMQA